MEKGLIVGLWLLGKNNVVKRQFTDLIFIMIIGLNFSLWYTSEKDKKITNILQMLGAMKTLWKKKKLSQINY